MHLLMFLVLQQLQQQNASVQRALGPSAFGPRAQTSAWKHLAAEAAKAEANEYWHKIFESLGLEPCI